MALEALQSPFGKRKLISKYSCSPPVRVPLSRTIELKEENHAPGGGVPLRHEVVRGEDVEDGHFLKAASLVTGTTTETTPSVTQELKEVGGWLLLCLSSLTPRLHKAGCQGHPALSSSLDPCPTCHKPVTCHCLGPSSFGGDKTPPPPSPITAGIIRAGMGLNTSQ